MFLHLSKIKTLKVSILNTSFSIFLLIILIIGLVLTLEYISAQTKNYFGIIIQPAIDSYTVEPGDVITGTVDLTNDFQERNPNETTYIGEETVTYYPSTIQFKQDGESGNPIFYHNNTDSDELVASRWITFDSTSYSMDYAEVKTVTYTITVPENAEPGGHYVALVFNEQQPESFNEQVSVNKAISELLFITVSGDVNSSGELLEFKSRKKIYEWPPLDFYIRYKNTGNVHEIVKGTVTIHRNSINSPIAVLDVNPDETIVLASSVRTYDIQQKEGFIYYEDGVPRANFNKLSQFYLGKYTATLQLEHMYNNQLTVTTLSVTFWIIPWKLILLIILLLLLITALAVGRKRRKKKQKVFKDNHLIYL